MGIFYIAANGKPLYQASIRNHIA